jgi:integrase
MEHGEYLAIRGDQLPADYQDALDFGYHSGWRRGEIFRLEWRDIDRGAGVIRLRPELSKNPDGRVLVLSPPLAQVIKRRWRGRVLGCPFVFHVKGKPIGEWRKTWTRPCQAAGLPGKLFHDLRRTVVRNLVRAGVTERVAMTMTGHKTRSVFDRYNIVNEGDLRQAATRHADYVAQQAPGPTVVPLPGMTRS